MGGSRLQFFLCFSFFCCCSLFRLVVGFKLYQVVSYLQVDLSCSSGFVFSEEHCLKNFSDCFGIFYVANIFQVDFMLC